MRTLIYRIINKTNGKSYIGQTTQGLRRRKSEHLYRFNKGDRDHKLYFAFRKYGFDGFEWQVLSRCQFNELDEKEIAFIKEYDTYENGYNMTVGGDSVGEETRKKLSKIFKGRKITWADKVWKTRRANWKPEKHGQFGKFGPDHCCSKKYIVTEPNGTAHFVHGLAEWCRNWTKEKLYPGALTCCAKGIYKTSKGYTCEYADNERSTISRKTYTQASGNGEHPIGVMI